MVRYNTQPLQRLPNGQYVEVTQASLHMEGICIETTYKTAER